MTNLALKLAVASGFASVLTFQGDQHQPRPAAASLDVLDTIAATAPDAAVMPSPAAVLPQRPRVSSRSVKTPEPLPAPRPEEIGRAGDSLVRPSIDPPPASPTAATAFAAEMIRLSAQADAVDRLWLVYKAECGVRVGRQYDFGREWFSIWDRAAEPTIDAPGCSDVLWRLLQAGESVRNDLLRARATAQQGLDRGTEIGMLRWHALQWP
jgi:hypothetical protein